MSAVTWAQPRQLDGLFFYRSLERPDPGVFAILTKEVRYVVPHWDDPSKEVVISVPAKFKTDLASIPRRLRGFVSIDRGVEEAILHDFLYAQNIGTREWADRVFYLMLKQSQSWITAEIMYRAVRLGGNGPWKQGARYQGDQT